MPTLQTLYAQNPGWIWLAAGAAFVILNMATGRARLIWPATAAVIIGALLLAKVRIGPAVQVVGFVALSATGLAASFAVKPLAALQSRPAAPDEAQS